MILILQRLGGFIMGEQVDSRRRNFYVEKEFQKSFAIFFVLVVFVLIIASGASCYVFLNNILEQNIYTIHPKVGSPSQAITSGLTMFFIPVTFVALIIILIAADRFMNNVRKSLMVYERMTCRLIKLDFKKARYLEPDRFSSLKGKYVALMGKYNGDILLLRNKIARMSQLIKLLDENTALSINERVALMNELKELKDVLDAKMQEYRLVGHR